MTQPKKRNVSKIVVLAMAAGTLITGVYGFGSKFEEFIRMARTPDGGGFALIPVLNYMFATAGFVCLFVWAMRNGMFKDIEGPKYDQLDRERELDRLDGIDWKE